MAAQRQVTPCKALSTAFVQACDRRLDLIATVGACSARTGTLTELLDTLPEGGMLSVLEGPGEAQGLMVLDADLLAAVIEQLMMGRLAGRTPKPRKPTRTDAALVADLVDDVLRLFETGLGDPDLPNWVSGYGYASYLDDARPLGLMMEDIDYRILTLTGELALGPRTFKLLLALPALGREDGRLTAGAAASAAGGDIKDADPAGEVCGWADALEAHVLEGRVTLSADLYRMTLTLGTLETLAPGQDLAIPGSALDETILRGVNGNRLAHGRLGQSQGKRAVRLATPDGGEDRNTPGPGLPEQDGVGSAPVPSAGSEAPASLPDKERLLTMSPAKPDDPPPLPSSDVPAALPDLGDLPDPDSLPSLDDLPALPDIGGEADLTAGLPQLGDLPKI